MLILLVEVVYLAYVLWGDHRRVEYVQALVALGDGWLRHLFSECCNDKQGWKVHHFSWFELDRN